MPAPDIFPRAPQSDRHSIRSTFGVRAVVLCVGSATGFCEAGA